MAKVKLYAVQPVQNGLELVAIGEKFEVDGEREAQQLIDSKSASRKKPDAEPEAEQTELV